MCSPWTREEGLWEPGILISSYFWGQWCGDIRSAAPGDLLFPPTCEHSQPLLKGKMGLPPGAWYVYGIRNGVLRASLLPAVRNAFHLGSQAVGVSSVLADLAQCLLTRKPWLGAGQHCCLPALCYPSSMTLGSIRLLACWVAHHTGSPQTEASCALCPSSSAPHASLGKMLHKWVWSSMITFIIAPHGEFPWVWALHGISGR